MKKGFWVISILIFISLLLILATWLFTLNEISSYSSNFKDLEKKKVEFDLKDGNQHLDNIIEQNTKNIKFLNKILTDEIEKTNDLTELKKLFQNFAFTHQDFFQIRFLDSLGYEKIRLNRNGSNFIFTDEDKLQYKGDRYYFNECKTKCKDESFVSISEFDLNIEHGVVQKPMQPTFRISNPVYLEDKFYGVLIANYDARDLLEQLNSKNLILINGNDEYFDLSRKDTYELKKSKRHFHSDKFHQKEIIINNDKHWTLIKMINEDSETLQFFKSKIYTSSAFIILLIIIGFTTSVYYISMISKKQKKLTAEYLNLEQVNKKLINAKKEINERDILISEIHHRVKNNLQIISSITSLEAYKLEDEKSKNSLKNVQGRIQSMSIVHELLYQNDLKEELKTKLFIERLVSQIINLCSMDIKTSCDIENIKINLDTAIPLGILINEIITNSVKYAFPDLKGHIKIRFEQKDSKFELIIEDNGIGFDSKKEKTSTGTKLIKALVKQLDGYYTVSNENGTKYIINFGGIKSVNHY